MEIPAWIKESRIPQAAIICLLIVVSIIAFRGVGGLQFLELSAYDYYLAIKNRDAVPDPRIILIKMTEDDIQKQGRWPVTDAVLADLLKGLLSLGPAVIGLDIYRDIEVPPGKKELLEIFSQKPIITVKKIGDEKNAGVAQPYMATNRELIGANDMLVDPDGVIRRGLLFLDDGKTVYSSFSLLLSLSYLGGQGISPEPAAENPEYMRIGKITFIPLKPDDGGYSAIDARGYQHLMDFRGGPFKSFNLTEALNGFIPKDALSGKIVIIGVTAESLKDFFFTPMSKAMSSDKLINGVELHGLMVSQLLRAALDGESPLTFIREKYEWGWIFLWALIGTLLGLRIRSLSRLFLSITGGLVILAGITYFTFVRGLWLPVVAPVFSFLVPAAVVTAYLSYKEKAERNMLMQLFSRHVSSDVAEAIWKDRDKFMNNGRPVSQKLTATVLFTDLKGFTSISEKMDPQTLMDWLNEYMDAMAVVIIRHKGVINKYIGDAVMAIFGVPVAKKNDDEISEDAISAVECALDMGEELKRLNSSWRQRDIATVHMRVGIFTGPLVAGCLGGSQRMEYTVIGNTVNTASRLESFGKEGVEHDFSANPCRILIGQATLKYLVGRYVTKRIGDVSLKGKEEKIEVYMVMGRTQRPENVQ
jgi:adenylate cyclase